MWLKMTSFSWLHLTDFHRGMKKQRWAWPGVREIFFGDLKRLHDKCGPWDLVLFTGDLTYTSSADEFKQLDDILYQIWQYFRKLGSDPKLLAVPGNHDLVRPENINDPTVLLLRQWEHQQSVQETFWDDLGSPYHEIINQAFNNYIAWWEHQPFRAKNIISGILPGDFSVTIEKENSKLGILGLNSAFLQLTDDNYEGKLALHTQQFHDSTGGDGPEWAKQHDACILMTHHPPTWLNAKSLEHINEEITSHGRFAVHLCGHMHETSLYNISGVGTATRPIFQGRSLFGIEFYGSKQERLHGYAAGKIKLEKNQGKLIFWPREARLQDVQRKIVPDFSLKLTDAQCTKPISFNQISCGKLSVEKEEKFQKGILSEIEAVGDKYLPDQYIYREIDKIVLSFLKSNSKLFVIVDSAGSGKTSFCCHLSTKIAEHRNVVFVNCGLVSDIFEDINRQLNSYGIKSLTNSFSDIFIILDGINEFHHLPTMRGHLRQFSKTLSTIDAQAIVTCRDVTWSYFSPVYDSLKSFFQNQTFSLGLLPIDTIDQAINSYFKKFGINGECFGLARRSMTHPLLLRFFCDAYESETLGRVKDIYLKDLFETYLNRKRTEISNRLGLYSPYAVDELLESIANAFWERKDTFLRTIEINLPHGGLNPYHGSIYSSLLESQILIEKQHFDSLRHISFKYDAFQDYITAKMIFRNILERVSDKKLILNTCSEFISSEKIKGKEKQNLEVVAGFIFAMARDQTKTNLIEWKNICKKDVLHSRAFLRALKQIPANKLLINELELVVSLAESEDPDTLRNARELIADRYSYLPEQLRSVIVPWLDQGYPGFVAQLLIENFGIFEETNWDSLFNLFKRDFTEITHGKLIEFSSSLVKNGNNSPNLLKILTLLRNSSDLKIQRIADNLIKKIKNV